MHQAIGVMESSMRDGNITMDRALRDALSAGLIDYEIAERLATNPKALDGWRSSDPPQEAAQGKKKGFW